MSSVCRVFNNTGERLSPSQYRRTILLSIINKLFEAITNKKAVDHFSRDNLLCDKQFRPARSSVDIIIGIKHRTSETLDNKYITGMIALDISKDFHKM